MSESEFNDYFRPIIEHAAAKLNWPHRPSVETYDKLKAEYTAILGDEENAAAIAFAVTDLTCAPIIPRYEAGKAIDRAVRRKDENVFYPERIIKKDDGGVRYERLAIADWPQWAREGCGL